MTSSAALFADSLATLMDAAAEFGAHTSGSRRLGDAELLAAHRAVAEIRRHVDAGAAVLAGEVVLRSNAAAGLDGLARREGYRTPEALVRGVTGSTSREATTLVRVGSMLNDVAALEHARAAGADSSTALPDADARPWLEAVGDAVAAGTLTIAAAESLRNGLGVPGPGVSGDDLAAAANRLVTAITRFGAAAGEGGAVADSDVPPIVATVDADTVLRMARDARDELDAAGIAERENQRRAQRSFRRWRAPDGMTTYTWRLDPEGAALIDDVYDKITSPRRGGPRFLTDDDRARAGAIERDERTTEQLASDGFLELVQLALGADASAIVGIHQPAVRVLVAARDLERGSGRGWIEGHGAPVSLATVERYACRDGFEEIIFDERQQPVRLGRTQRVFNRTQRRMLSARDGGCRWPGCERPPEWTEAHHIRWWDRDRGPTDIDNGILLCRHHHLLLHDNGWEIQVRPGPRRNKGGGESESTEPGETEHWLVPPASIDPQRRPRRMPSRSPAYRDAHRTRERVPATA